MSAEARRESLIDTTLKLLRTHGRDITTRQIAEAEGVAEGTIFRQFDTKDELVEAALQRAFDPGPLLDRVRGIDHDQSLELRMVALVALLQQRLKATFALMQKVGAIRPPNDHTPEAEAFRTAMSEATTTLIGDDADRLTMTAEEAVHRLRMLTFAASHPHISDGHGLTPDQIVDTVLYGVLTRGEH